MTVSLVASVARNGVIGRGNELVWDEPLDKQHFRRVTMGGPVIMGRKTWDSLPVRFRPLPGRRNIVVTRQVGWHGDGAEAADSVAEALSMCAGSPKVSVIGGAQIYVHSLPHADELILTEIERDFEGDAFFPSWDRSAFVEVSRESHVADDGVRFHFVTYRRRS